MAISAADLDAKLNASTTRDALVVASPLGIEAQSRS